MNVILHTLAHIPPFRDYFLRTENYSHIKPPPGDQIFILGGWQWSVEGSVSSCSSCSPFYIERDKRRLEMSLSFPSSLPPSSSLPSSSSLRPPSPSPPYSTPSPSSVQRLGELFRKLWNPRNFKAHVSPHEMLQAVASTSKKRFKITEQGGCVCVCDCAGALVSVLLCGHVISCGRLR